MTELLLLVGPVRVVLYTVCPIRETFYNFLVIKSQVFQWCKMVAL